jgi:hypothetical protein
MYKRLWRRAALFIGAPFGEPEEGFSTGDFERWMKGAQWMKGLSLKKLRGGGREG